MKTAIEPMPGCHSVAVCLLIPMGITREPGTIPGAAAIAEEWVFRGAGDLDNRAFNHALDRLGAQRHTHLDARYLQISAVCLHQQLPETLTMVADLAQRPRLDDADFGPVKELCLQSLSSLEDEPEERISLLLRSRFHPAPFNRSPYGQREAIQNATPDDIRSFVHAHSQPDGSILTIAGGINPETTAAQINDAFKDWLGQTPGTQPVGEPLGGTAHEKDDSQQTHICVGFQSAPETAQEILARKVGLTCLSGGASGRLFTEVREKRSLCYSVSAGYAGDQDRGGIYLYAGTTPQRAQETLDVMLQETRRVEDGVTQDEFNRARVSLLSRLVMQGESTEARASAIARDIGVFGRARSLAERAEALRSLDLATVNASLQGITQSAMTLATLGPEPLTTPEPWPNA